jgi:hypothetical protein
MQHTRSHDDRKDRPDCKGKRAQTDGPDRKSAKQSGRAHGINQRPARHLARECNQSAGGQNEADIELRPMVRSQIDRDKWTKTGLDVGQEKSKPIKSARAGGRRAGGRSRKRLRRRKRWCGPAAAADRAVKLQCDRRQVIISGTVGELQRRFSANAPLH